MVGGVAARARSAAASTRVRSLVATRLAAGLAGSGVPEGSCAQPAKALAKTTVRRRIGLKG